MTVPSRSTAPRISNAQLFAELEAIRAAAGELTGATVVQYATAPDHPLHARYFSKTEAQLAHDQRVHLANEDIRSVTVEYVSNSGTTEKVRGYVSVTRAARPVYEPTRLVAADPVLSALLLQTAEREWRALFDRYKHLEEFVNIVQADLTKAAAA